MARPGADPDHRNSGVHRHGSRTRSPGMREGMKSGGGRWLGQRLVSPGPGDTKGAPQRRQTQRIRVKQRWGDSPAMRVSFGGSTESSGGGEFEPRGAPAIRRTPGPEGAWREASGWSPQGDQEMGELDVEVSTGG